MIERNPDEVRRRELAMIHIAKTQLGMADEVYRDLLRTIGRVDSSKDLDWAGRKRLLEHFKKCGFKAKPAGRSGARELVEDELTKKIRALWLELHAAGVVRDPSESALARWVKRMTGVDSLRWLKPQRKATVIEALKKWNDRPRPA